MNIGVNITVDNRRYKQTETYFSVLLFVLKEANENRNQSNKL